MAIPTLPRNLLGVDSTTWVIRNDVGTDNGLPTGGISKHTSGFPGLGLADASVGNQADAVDNGLLLFVNNQIFVAPGSVDITGSTLTTGTVNLSGLDVSVQFYADQTQPVLRTVVTFTNPTNAPISVPISWATNVGSNTATTVQATSSGDTSFSIGDRWIITDDTPTGGDPANTFVLFGPGSPTVGLSSVSQTVYDFSITAGTEGILANYDITIPAHSTRSLLFFNGINPSSSDAQSFSSTYDSVSALESSTLLTGLSDEQRAQVLNWRFIPRAIPGTTLADTLQGTRKQDFLFGSDGDDILTGGKGSDVLEGGLDSDILRGGAGPDTFVYSGPTRARSLMTSNLQRGRIPIGVDQLPDLNVRKGDRLVVGTPTVTRVPTRVYNVGTMVGRSPIKLMDEAFDDKNQVRRGQQAVKPNEAIVVRGKTKVSSEPHVYIAVNDGNVGFSPNKDLVLDITGASLMPGDDQAFSLNPTDYFLGG